MTLRSLPIIALCAIAACSASDPDPTNSAFATPSASGDINRVSGSGSRTGSDTSGTTGNTYGYEVGGVSGEGLQGFAGIASGASVSAPPAMGPVTYTGTFEVGLIDFIFTSGNSVQGTSVVDTGAITLNADFTAGTVTGGGTGLNLISSIVLNGNPLVVNGSITGDQLSGTVTYDDVSGPLTGLIGTNEVIGAFHGHTDGQVHAGGFIAN